MTRPDITYFDHDGVWIKPSRLVRADIVLQAGGGGASEFGQRGEDGEIAVHSIPGDELPARVRVNVGRGGRPGGQDGYVLIVAHLAEANGHAPKELDAGSTP